MNDTARILTAIALAIVAFLFSLGLVVFPVPLLIAVVVGLATWRLTERKSTGTPGGAP